LTPQFYYINIPASKSTSDRQAQQFSVKNKMTGILAEHEVFMNESIE